MLLLIVGIVLLVLSIAGGAIVNPLLFILGLVAIFIALSGYRTL